MGSFVYKKIGSIKLYLIYRFDILITVLSSASRFVFAQKLRLSSPCFHISKNRAPRVIDFVSDI